MNDKSIKDMLRQLFDKLNMQDKRITALEKKKDTKISNIKQKEESLTPLSKSHQYDWKKLELTVGKYLLQIIGSVLLIVGMGFFFKYSIEQGWIQPLVRILIGTFVGLGLIFYGKILEKKYWTIGSTSAGFSILYISSYSAYSFYGLLSPTQLIIATLSITLFACLLAILHDSKLLGIFSLIGGFITPIFLEKSFFIYSLIVSYVLVLSLVFIFLALVKRWPILAFSSLFFTCVYAIKYNFLCANGFIIVGLYSLIFFCIYALIPYLFALFSTNKRHFFEPKLIFISTFFSFFHLLSEIDLFVATYPFFFQFTFYNFNDLINKIPGEQLNLFIIKPLNSLFAKASLTITLEYLSLLFGLICLIEIIIFILKKRKIDKLLSVLIFLTTVFFAYIIFLHWSKENLCIMLQIYSFLIFALSLVFKNKMLQKFSFVFWGISLLSYIQSIRAEKILAFDSLIFNSLNITTLILVLFLGTASFISYKLINRFDASDKWIPLVLETTTILTLLAWLGSSLWILPYNIIGISILATSILLYSIILKKDHIKICSYGFLSVSIGWFTIIFNNYLLKKNLFKLSLIIYIYILLFVFIVFMIKYFRKKLSNKEYHIMYPIFSILFVFFTFLLGKVNLTLRLLDYGALSVIIAIYSGFYALTLILAGFFWNKKFIRYLGLCFSGFTIYRLSLVIIAMKETSSRFIAFITVGIIFILVSFIYQRLSKKID